MSDVQLGGGREFDLIRRMRARWGDLAVGIGDDAAVIDAPRGEQIVASTDAAVEGVHFRRDWFSLEEIGYRALTAALSDLAAMASKPLGVLVSLQLPALRDEEIAALADGIGGAARRAGTVIRGGNVAVGETLALTSTVIGSVWAPLRRTGASPGDAVYVTGALGGPAAAIRALEGGRTPDARLRERLARPVARIDEARWLSARGAVAGIDLSDGLGGDAAHLAAASGVTVEIDLDQVPVTPGAAADDVFGGEEYELLVITRAALPAEEFTRRFGIPLNRVGTVRDGTGEARFRRGGKRVASPGGYDHLSR